MEQIEARILDRDYKLAVNPDEKSQLIDAVRIVDGRMRSIRDGGRVTGVDVFVGDANANRLVGNGGNDRLTGRAGNDILEGGAGNDRLVGEQGLDAMTGGADADTFVFNLAPAAGGLDRITDFEAGIDKLEIDASLFGGGLVAGGVVSLVSGSAPTSTGFAAGVFHYDTDDGFLYWDADGQGAGARLAIVRLQNLPVLAAGDFTVVA